MQNKQGIILKDYKEIKEILAQNGVQRPFLCCGKSFEKTELFKYLKKFNIVVFDKINGFVSCKLKNLCISNNI